VFGAEFFRLSERDAVALIKLNNAVKGKAITSLLQRLTDKLGVLPNQLNIKHLQPLK
jgi:hypothetical protein